MLKNIRNKRAQNTAEYAILIALVIGGIVAMQTYAQRAMQARVRDTSMYMANTMSTGLGSEYTTKQYEPYYQNTYETANKGASDAKFKNGQLVGAEAYSNTSKTAYTDRTEYNATSYSDRY